MNKPRKRRNDAVNSDVVFAAGISSDPYLYGGLGFGWDYEWEDTGNDVECGGYNLHLRPLLIEWIKIRNFELLYHQVFRLKMLFRMWRLWWMRRMWWLRWRW